MQGTREHAPPLIEMRNIVNFLRGVGALDGGSLELYPGEIHALAGEKGAGKSKLIKVLAGVYTEYEGDVCIAGVAQRFGSVRKSEEAGIAVVFQELSLVPELTVGENIFLGREPAHFGVVRWDELYAKASHLLRELGLDLDPRTRAGKLGTGKQQLVEIAKALSRNARILDLDEQPAALTDAEAEVLFTILGKLCHQGIGIIYVSHRLHEGFRLSRRGTVLRDGRTVATVLTSQMTEHQLITNMVGRGVSQAFPPTRR